MRGLNAMYGSIAAMMALSLVSPAPEMIVPRSEFSGRGSRIGSRHNKNLPGRRDYPHSSTRQRARYARQIAAGKLNF
jgi:hypothetical protein